MKTIFSRRELYALGEPIGDSATVNKVGGGRIYGMGGGGGGGTTQSTGTTYTTNVPEYARPYVETMLGATQKQLFEGTPTEGGGFDITGFKPYQPYSTNPSDYVAPFSPMQQQAQQSVAGMQVPGQYQGASDITAGSIMNAADVGQQARGLESMGMRAADVGNQYGRMATNPYAMQSYMSPYMQNVVDTQQREAIRQSNMQRVANQAQATQAGAFGGARQGIVEAERQRNLGTQLGDIQAKGLQDAYQQAQQAQQFRANLGLQGMQAGAGMYGQGISGQQAAINQALQGANQYATLGGQQLQAQQGIANLQSTMGAQQQAAEQQKINQAIQDYANAQQYPLMQLGVMSNMLRGLPMQASTTNQYVATPNALTQGIGLAGAGVSLANAFKAEGGVIKEMAKGGIASVPRYDVGGEVASQLENMDVEELTKQSRESSSPTIRRMAQRLLREKQMEQGAGINYQAPQLAGGGIIAFSKPTDDNNQSLVDERIGMGVPRERAGMTDVVSGMGRGVKDAIGSMFERAPRESSIRGETDYVPPVAAAAPAPAAEVPAPAPARPARPAPVRAAAPAADRAGIMAAAPTGPLKAPEGVASEVGGEDVARRMVQGAPAPAGILTPQEPDFSGPLGEAKRAVWNAQKEANMSEDEYLKKVQAGKPVNEAAQNLRKETMEELANSKDEATRKQWMRAVQFFAKWGSTPGPTLAAGLSVLDKTMPDLISDEAEYKKLKRELNKSIFDIDNAIRMEELGDRKEARALKEKAAERTMHLQQALIQAQASERHAQIQKESAKYTADKHLEGQKAISAAHDRATAAGQANAADDKAFRATQVAAQSYENVMHNIQTEKTKGQYAAAVDTIKTYGGATNLDEGGKQRLAAAEKIKADLDKVYNAREENARNILAGTQQRYLDRKIPGVSDPFTPAAPAAAPAASKPTRYEKPAGMNDAQWEQYKKDVGVK